MISERKGGSAWEFVKSMSLGGVAGFAGDALVEVTRFPYLNETAPLGGPNMSNYELVTYGGGLFMSALGFLDMVTGNKLGGITKYMLPTGLGVILGTNLYEQHGSKLLGIRA